MYKPIEGKLVQFMTSDGLELEGFLVAPKKKTRKCIIFLHGMEGNFHESPMPIVIAEHAKKAGVALFSMDTRGHDVLANITRVVNGKQGSHAGGTTVERFEDSPLDIDAAIAALRGMGFKRFVLCGHSTGCQKAAYYQYARKSKSVSGIVLLAPVSDYEDEMNALRGEFDKKVRIARRLAAGGSGDAPFTELNMHYSPNRFLSVADLKSVEARLFDYEGKLSEFRSITVPILALFGTKDQYAHTHVSRYIERMRSTTGSKLFEGLILNGANHGFDGEETKVAREVCKFAAACK